MNGVNKKGNDNVWLRALVVLVTLVFITLGVVMAVFRLGDGSATVEFVKGDWKIVMGGTCGFFMVIFAAILRSYKQLLKILGCILAALLGSLFAPETVPPNMYVIPKGNWLVMLLILIVGGYIYFAFRFIKEGKLERFSK